MKRLMRFAFSVASRLVTRAFSFAIVTLLWLADANSSLWAYTSVRVALGSNILVDGKRVIFAQGTGSLTALNLDTGEVLLRKKPGSNFEYSGQLQRSVHGVLMSSYGRIALLDGNTLEPVWRADQCYGAVSDGEHVVAHDGNHSVTCRNVQSGRVSWKIDMEGGWHLVAASGKVLVVTPDHWGRRSALLILDVKSGGQILRHEAAPDVHWLQVCFDGQLVYLVAGKSTERDRSPRSPVEVKALDLEGKVVAKVDYQSPEVVPNPWQGNNAFIWGARYFHDGRVQPVDSDERKALTGIWKKGEGFRDIQGDREFFRQRDYFPQLLPSGIFVNFPSKDADDKVGQLLQVIKSKGSWRRMRRICENSA